MRRLKSSYKRKALEEILAARSRENTMQGSCQGRPTHSEGEDSNHQPTAAVASILDQRTLKLENVNLTQA